jgi:hypothetical protein
MEAVWYRPPEPGSPRRAEYDEDLETLRGRLEEDSLTRAWREGKALDLEAALDEAAEALEALASSLGPG